MNFFSSKKIILSIASVVILSWALLYLNCGNGQLENPSDQQDPSSQKTFNQLIKSAGSDPALADLFRGTQNAFIPMTPPDPALSGKDGAKGPYGPVLLGQVTDGLILELQQPSVFTILNPLIERGAKQDEIDSTARAQMAAIETEHQNVMDDLNRNSAIAQMIKLSRIEHFKRAFNGIAISGMDLSRIRPLLESNKLIKKVYMNTRVQTQLLDSPGLIQATANYRKISSTTNKVLDGYGVKIGIIDTGVEYTHPDLGGCFGAGCKVAGGYDFVNLDADPMDDHGHGTHVSATAAGLGSYVLGNNTPDLLGVAPGATLYAYKVLTAEGWGQESWILGAIEACADPDGNGSPSDHLDVCSMSLGGGGNPDDPMSLAVDQSTNMGVVFSIAAGNSGSWGIGSPGTSRKAITVAASCKPGQVGTDPYCTDAIASFSSWGPVVWTDASGQSQTLEKPDIAAPGHLICAAQGGNWLSDRECLDGRHIAISGTSMATPHVAGFLAILKQAKPSLTPSQLKTILKNTALPLGVTINREGKGLVQFTSALAAATVTPHKIQIPSSPLVIRDVPSLKIQSYQRDLNFTNTGSNAYSVQGWSTNLPAGITAVPLNALSNLPAGQTQILKVKFTVDHSILAPNRIYMGDIKFKMIDLSTQQASIVTMGSYIQVGSYVTVTPNDISFPLFSPTGTTATTPVTIKNLIQNMALNVGLSYGSAFSDVQRSFDFWVGYNVMVNGNLPMPGVIVDTLYNGTVISSLPLAAGAQKIVNLRADVTGADSQAYMMNYQLTTTAGSTPLLIPVHIYKGYAIKVDSQGVAPTVLYTIDSTSGAYKVSTPMGVQQTFLVSNMNRVVDVYAKWKGTGHLESSWVLKKGISMVYPETLVGMPLSSSIYDIVFDPVDRSGNHIDPYILYNFHGANYVSPFLSHITGTQDRIRVNQLSNYFRFTAGTSYNDPQFNLHAWSYKLFQGVSSNVTFTNQANQLIASTLKYGDGLMYTSATSLPPVSGGLIFGSVGAYIDPTAQLYFYSNATSSVDLSDLTNDPFGRTPGAQIHAWKAVNNWNSTSFSTPKLFPTIAKRYQWSDFEHNYYGGQDQAVWTQSAEPTTSNYIHGAVDQINTKSISVGAGIHSNNMTMLNSGFDMANSLKFGDNLVYGLSQGPNITGSTSFTMTGNGQTYTCSLTNAYPELVGNCGWAMSGWQYAPNTPYTLNITSDIQNAAGVSTQVNLMQHFYSTSNPVYMHNPPQIRLVKLLEYQQLSAQYEEVNSLQNQNPRELAFVLAPNGDSDQSVNNNYPNIATYLSGNPSYLPDEIAYVAAEYQTSFAQWSPLQLTLSNNPNPYVYRATIPPVCTNSGQLGQLVNVRITAKDLFGNETIETIQIPCE